jgi:hypothetical protein
MNDWTPERRRRMQDYATTGIAPRSADGAAVLAELDRLAQENKVLRFALDRALAELDACESALP